MPGEIPFFIVGKVVDLSVPNLAIVKVVNGNLYNVNSNTPGVEFSKLSKGQLVELEITNALTRVFSARIITGAVRDD